MALLYLVENDESCINNWGCYWLVEAKNKREAIDKVYKEEAKFINPRESGILKKKLDATRVDELLINGVYTIH